MDILTGDPFYYNIIYHLSLQDLNNLKCTCTHLNDTITKTVIKNITIHKIKHQLHQIFGDMYDSNIKKIKDAKSNDKILYNKYFVVTILKGYHKFKSINANFHINISDSYSIHMKGVAYRINYSRYTINILGDFNCLLYFESLDEKNIEICKIRSQCWGSHSNAYDLFWIENDSDDVFDLLNYL
jgi:hypothetical protein